MRTRAARLSRIAFAAVLLLALAVPAHAQDASADATEAALDAYLEGSGSLRTELIPLFLAITVLSVAPGILIMVTCFPFMAIVFSFLRQALGLLKEAGYQRDGTRLVGPDGKPFTIEILGFSPTWQRVHAPFIASVRRLGIDISFRVVDTSQYVERLNNFDFDLIVATAAQSSSPGNEQREYWSSSAADQPGSRNFAGIKDPVIDELVEKLIYATDRDELVAHTKALDRILKHSHYAIPQWHNPAIWTARWDKFGIPRPQPGYIGIDTESWWIDPDKAAAIGVSR